MVFRVASVGECMVELRHRSPSDLELAYGGDTLNFAVYLSRLVRDRGARVDYVTALVDDAYSDKYAGSGSSLRMMITGDVRTTTLRVTPVPA